MNVGENLRKLFSLENKVILLTGATGGIGSELAKGMAQAGGELALCDMDLEKLAGLEKEIKEFGGSASSFYLNMLEKDSIGKCVDDVVAKYGRIDVLVNCAGINKREGMLDVEEETYDRIMNINLKGLYLISQKVGLQMVKQNYGNVINIGSHNSVGMLGGCSVYGATKSAVAAITRSMAVEWAKHNIRANCICPGHILTPLTQVTWDNPRRVEYLKPRIAMGRPGLPEEIVGLTVLLASDASSYMSGQMYHIDGGCLAGGQPWEYDTKY